jgi:hypothetical protein
MGMIVLRRFLGMGGRLSLMGESGRRSQRGGARRGRSEG